MKSHVSGFLRRAVEKRVYSYDAFRHVIVDFRLVFKAWVGTVAEVGGSLYAEYFPYIAACTDVRYVYHHHCSTYQTHIAI